MQILSLERFWCITFADCAALGNCVSVILNNERTYMPPSICIPWIPPFQSSFLSRFSLAVFLHGLTRNNSKQESAHVRCVTEKKMMLTQQHAWKTLAMLRHVFNNVGYIYRKRRCRKSNKTGMHDWNSGPVWKLDQCETIGLTEYANYQLFSTYSLSYWKISHCINAMVKNYFYHYEYGFWRLVLKVVDGLSLKSISKK